MTDSLDLDLTGLQPSKIRLLISEEEEILIDSDQPTLLVGRAALWFNDYLTFNDTDPTARKFSDNDGWEIVAELAGRDLRGKITTLGMVKLLHFFRDRTLAEVQKILSSSPFALLARSTEQSPSETSSEAQPSSDAP